MADGPYIFGQVRVDDEGRVDEALACLHCGRELRGGPLEGACGGCGKPIEDSTRPDLLRFQSPVWLTKLTLALVVVVTGVVLALACGGVRLAWVTGKVNFGELITATVWNLLLLLPTVVTGLGLCLLASKRPLDFEAESPWSARHLLQWTAGAAVALAVLFFLADGFSGKWGLITGLRMRYRLPWLTLIHAVCLVSVYFGHRVGAGLARQAPDHTLAKWLGVAAWCNIVTMGMVYFHHDFAPIVVSVLRPSYTLADEGLAQTYQMLIVTGYVVNGLAVPAAVFTLVLAGWLALRIRQAAGRYRGLD